MSLLSVVCCQVVEFAYFWGRGARSEICVGLIYASGDTALPPHRPIINSDLCSYVRLLDVYQKTGGDLF